MFPFEEGRIQRVIRKGAEYEVTIPGSDSLRKITPTMIENGLGKTAEDLGLKRGSPVLIQLSEAGFISQVKLIDSKKSA